MAYRIACRSATAHRETGNCTVPLVGHNPVLLLDVRHKLLEEVILVAPLASIEIAVKGSSGIGHHNHHLLCLATTEHLGSNSLSVTLVTPRGVGIGKAVQQIKHWELPVLIAITCRQIYAIFLYSTKNLTLHLTLKQSGIAILCHGLEGYQHYKQKKRQLFFHNL